MSACHTIPFIQPGVVIQPPSPETDHLCPTTPAEACDYCGSARLGWRKCKLVCDDCKQINKSCADL